MGPRGLNVDAAVPVTTAAGHSARRNLGSTKGNRVIKPSESAPAVLIENVCHSYRKNKAVDDVSLAIQPGEFLTLLGSSGSGKTTLLRVIAGLLQPNQGKVWIGGRDVTRLAPQHRDVGMVFQNYALFPHMNVAENIAYPLKIRRVPKAEREQRVTEALARVGLPGYEKRRTDALSGGQQQRIAVARALVYEPSVLLMDEPLGALDRKLRKHMQVELRSLQQELEITCIFVTHDQEEAMAMSDRIGIMDRGQIRQLASPATLYRSPTNSFVADFMGEMNFFTGHVSREESGDCVLRTQSGLNIPVNAAEVPAATTEVVVGIRPEYVKIGAEQASFSTDAAVQVVLFSGTSILIEARTTHGHQVQMRLGPGDQINLQVGDRISVGWSMHDQFVFARTAFEEDQRAAGSSSEYKGEEDD